MNFTSIIDPEKITPLEYLILKTAKKPKTIGTLSMLLNAPEEVIKKGLFRLQLKGMIIIKGEFVEINWRKLDLMDYGLVKPVFPF